MGPGVDDAAGLGRRHDTEHRLTATSVWVTSASPDGAPYLVPLSFDWDGGALLVATATDSPTGRNLAATQTTRSALGHMRDVAVIDGTAEVLDIDALPQLQGDRFAARAGFYPAGSATPYRWFRISPRRFQAWREENALRGRELTGVRRGEALRRLKRYSAGTCPDNSRSKQPARPGPPGPAARGGTLPPGQGVR
ncbi:pyridoxamine 5'-phosphate oxidase family protein [Streptomyces pilosus]|uniref:pyridoxamine 5'-phosphate oxidase family protein n=1 Tax=Streptomyces pilosus TaxID=28893 RepID=UPI0036FDBE6B